MRKGETGCEGGDWGGQKSSVNKEQRGREDGRLTTGMASDEDMSIWNTPVKEDILSTSTEDGGRGEGLGVVDASRLAFVVVAAG